MRHQRTLPRVVTFALAAINVNRTSAILGTRALITRGRSSKEYWTEESKWVLGAWLAVQGPLFFGMILMTLITAFTFGFAAAELLPDGGFREWAIYWSSLVPICAGACGLIEASFRADSNPGGPRARRAPTPVWKVDLVRNPVFLLPSSAAGYLVAAFAAQVLVVLLP